MADIILPGIVSEKGNINSFLKEWFGITGRYDGSDLIISEKDAAKGFSAKDFIHLHYQLPLEDNNLEVARKLYKQISDEVKNIKPKIDRNFIVQDGYGNLSIKEMLAIKLAVSDDDNAIEVLEKEVIPFMKDTFGANFVTGVSVDMGSLQSHQSFSKLGLIMGKYGTEKTEELVFKGKALSILSYFDGLMQISPIAFTLPFHRDNCAWHFQSEGMWLFKHELTNAFSAKFLWPVNPLSDLSEIIGLDKLGMDENNIWKYMRTICNGINRLISYLIDIRNFVEDGKVNFLKQVQAHSAIHLLFADIIAINFSSEAHHKISFCFSALDKFANLRVQLGNSGGSEPDMFKALCSESQYQQLLGLYDLEAQTFGYQNLFDNFKNVANDCYLEIKNHFNTQGAFNESESLGRLYSQRNIRHGAFLRFNQFENLFLESSGTVPDGISVLPYLLMLGLLINPKKFLEFRPNIQG